MNNTFTTRPVIEIDPCNLPEVYPPQAVLIKSVRSDGISFRVDIGRICYLEREKDGGGAHSGKHYVVGRVDVSSLSMKRIDWLRNYLDAALCKGWRNETLRGYLHLLRSFFQYCDFDGGEKPESLEALVREYQRYQIELDQRVRISGKACLSPSSASKALYCVSEFIKLAFQLSNNELIGFIPKYRSRKSKIELKARSVSQQDGQKYLQTCAMYFNQFADAILKNHYPIRVTPLDSTDDSLYWHENSGASLKSLPGCFQEDGSPFPYEDIKEIIGRNFKSGYNGKNEFYERTFAVNKKNWMNETLSSQKRYSYNLSTFCFFQVYLGFTGANVQPTLDLKISDLDLEKIGTTAFSKKYKYRAGRIVHFNAPSQLKREVLKYLRLRDWAESLELSENGSEYLFVKFSESEKLQRLDRAAGNGLLSKSTLFEGVKRVSSAQIRQIVSEYFIRKSQGKISLVARKLNNTITTTAKSYSALDLETQALEMSGFHEKLTIQIRQFNRLSNDLIPVNIANKGEAEKVASGSCSNIKGELPERAIGFNNEAPEPSCGTFESCLFCEYFAIHKDFEDIHKLLSLREALHAVSVIRNDPEHNEAVIQPALYRIDEILEYVATNDEKIKILINKVETELDMGNYSKHWSAQIQTLNNEVTNIKGGDRLWEI